MSAPKEIQALEAGLSETGKQQLEEIKAAVGLYGDRDPSLSFFVSLQSLLDRMERFGPKFADTVRQSAHEARSDAVKAGDLTMAQVVERGLATATQEMTAEHSAAIRELTAEATQVIRQSQPPTKNWRLWASLALIAQVGLLCAVGFSGWWYRDHQASESTAWAETWRGKQAHEFYNIITKSAIAATGGNRVLQPGGPGEKQLRAILAWAAGEEGVQAYFSSHPQPRKK